MREKGKNHPDVIAALESMPSVLEPWGMMHLISAFNKVCDERDALKAAGSTDVPRGSVVTTPDFITDALRYRWLKEHYGTEHGSATVEWRVPLGYTEVYPFDELVDKGMANSAALDAHSNSGGT